MYSSLRGPLSFFTVVVACVGCSLEHPASSGDARSVPNDVVPDTDGERPDVSDMDVSDARIDEAPPDTMDASDGSDGDVPQDLADTEDAMDVRDAEVPDLPDVLDVPEVPDVLDVPEVPDVLDVPEVPDACEGASCGYGSCANLPPGSASGVYTLRGRSGTWRGWCHVAGDGGPPWTLVMKVNGNQNTFQYNSPHWTTATVLNETDLDFDREENAKYEGFNATPMRQIRLRTSSRFGYRERTITTAELSSPSTLLELFQNPPASVRVLGSLMEWLELYPEAQLHTTCQRFGLNVGSTMGMFARVRLGGVGDNSNASCNMPNSWVGVGGFVNHSSCAMGTSISAGNVLCQGSTGHQISIFTWIFVR